MIQSGIIRTPDDSEVIAFAQTYFSKEYTTTANIAAGAIAAEVFIADDDMYGNGPFDSMFISNRDDIDLAVRLDLAPANRIIVPSGNTIFVKGLAFRNFTIENLDGTTAHTAGSVSVLVVNTNTPRRV